MIGKFLHRGSKLLVVAIMIYLGIFLLLNLFQFKGRPLIYSLNSDLILEGGNTYERFRDFDQNKKYDVIVMGSSHAYRGFDPRIFAKNNVSMFNLGSTSQSLIDTEILLKNSVYANNTDLLIVELFPLTFVERGYESLAYLAASHPNDKIVNKMLLERCDLRSLNLFTQRQFRKLDDKPIYETNDYILNGYCERLDSLKTLPNYIKNKKFNPKKKNEKALVGMIDHIKSNKIKTIFVCHPIPIQSDSLLFAEFDQYMESMVQDYDITYLNYSREIKLDSKNHFFDHSHLNQAGVEVFNERLLKDLRELNLLSER